MTRSFRFLEERGGQWEGLSWPRFVGNAPGTNEIWELQFGEEQMGRVSRFGFVRGLDWAREVGRVGKEWEGCLGHLSGAGRRGGVI